MKYLKIMLVSFFILIAVKAQAEMSLRCPNNIISLNDSFYLVQKACGEPQDINTWTEERVNTESVTQPFTQDTSYTLAQHDVIIDTLHEWTYDFGSNKISYVLKFKNRKLVKISSLGRID